MNHKKHYISILIFAGLLFLPSAYSCAQAALPLGNGAISEQERTAWVSEKWSSSDKAFVLAKKQIQQKVQSSKDKIALAATYRELFKKSPKSSVLLFKWGMSTFYASKTKPSTWSPEEIYFLLTSLDTVPSPHSLQYDRMRFLLQSHFRGEGFLKTMGLRLLKVNPQDDDVRALMILVLNVVGNPADGQLAINFAKQLIARHPTDPRWYAMLGSAYDLVSVRTNSLEDCQKSISAFKSCLKLAKKSDFVYSHAQYMIDVIEKNLPKS